MRMGDHITRFMRIVAVALLSLAITGCEDAESQVNQVFSEGTEAIGSLFSGPDPGTTDGPAYSLPSSVRLAPAAISSADATEWGTIDTSTVTDGYVTVSVINSQNIKFQVLCGEMSYNYDVPGDGTPVTCPINMGDGYYLFRVMQNTSGNNYVELNAVGADVWLPDSFSPFLCPSTIVKYDANSACVSKAYELAAGASNQGDVLAAVCNYIVSHVRYDNAKAKEVANVSGYLPNPDETLSTGKGICFDYSALGAAMLRSLGIPTKVMTGYVSPDDVYHAWIMVYIDGSWHNVQFNVESNTWSRMDLTFASGGSASLVGDGTDYTDRYTY